MKNPKVIIIFAATGFVLSLLTGIIFRVSFGVVILRALIFTVLFGGLVFLSNFILQNYFIAFLTNDGISVPNSVFTKESETGDFSSVFAIDCFTKK